MTDKFIVVIYLLIILGIGVYHRAKSHSLQNLGSVSVGTISNQWVLVATIFTTSIGGGTIFGIFEKTFSDSLAWAYGIILTVPVDIAIAFFIVPKLIRYHEVVSIGDIIKKHYGNYGKVITGVSATISSVGYIAAQISVSGRIFEFILGIKAAEGLILSYLVVIIYTAVGGLRSIIATHLLQFLAMIATVPIITIFGIYKLGVNNILNQISTTKYSLCDPNLFWNTIKMALSFSVMSFYPSFIQRALINKNPLKTRSAVIIKSCLYIFFILCVGINGLLAFCFVPEQPATMALPVMIDIFFPPTLKGILVIGLLAAVISTADANLNIASVSIVNDIIKPLVHIEGQTILFLLTQIITILVGSISIYIALQFNSVLELVIFVIGFWAPPLLVPFIFSLFDINISFKAFIANILIGLGSFIVWECYNLSSTFGIAGVFIGSLMSLLFFISVKLLTTYNKSNVHYRDN